MIYVGLGFLLPLICLISIVFAVIALTGVSRYGREGILRRSLSGLVLSAVLLAIWGMGFVHGFQTAMQKRRAANPIIEAVTEQQDHLKKEFAQKGAIGPDDNKDVVKKMRAIVDSASHDLTGDDVLVAKAGSVYLDKLQALHANYTAAAQALKSQAVLSMSGVSQREQLAGKKETVDKFMSANEKLMAFFTKAEDILRGEMVRLKLPPAKIESELKNYRRTAGDQNFLILKIRMTDQQIGTAMLGMLDALDANWGNWKYSPEKKNVIFQNTSVVAKYNEFFRNMKAASAEQAQLQAQLVNLPTMASTQ